MYRRLIISAAIGSLFSFAATANNFELEFETTKCEKLATFASKVATSAEPRMRQAIVKNTLKEMNVNSNDEIIYRGAASVTHGFSLNANQAESAMSRVCIAQAR